MPQNYSEGALRSAYNNAASHFAPMNAQIIKNGQRDVKDNSVIHTSSMSPVSVVFGSISKLVGAEIPSTKFSLADEDWSNFLFLTGIPAMVVLAAGVIMCIWLLCKLSCLTPKLKALTERPSTWHLRWTTISGFLVLTICIGICVGRGAYAHELIYYAAVDLQPDVDFICGKITTMQPGFHNAAIWLEEWQKSCIGWSALEPVLGATIRKVNKDYTDYVSQIAYYLYSLDHKTKHLPELLENFKLALEATYKGWILIPIFLPTVLASAVCFFIVFMTLCGGVHPRMARITNFLILDCGAVPIVLVMLLMTAISACFMYVGTGLGGFCWEPERNSVNIVSAAGVGPKLTSLVGYYVEGHPDKNDIVETLRTVESILEPINSYMWIIEPALDLLGILCNRVGSSDLYSLIRSTVPDVQRIIPLARRDQVYARYNDIVVRGFCGQLTSAIGWYMICQIFCGMVLLPIIAVESHKYLTYVSQEASIKMEQQQETEALMQKEEEEAKQKQQQQQQRKNNFWICGRRGGGREVGVSPTIN